MSLNKECRLCNGEVFAGLCYGRKKNKQRAEHLAPAKSRPRVTVDCPLRLAQPLWAANAEASRRAAIRLGEGAPQ
jgi:hypothetical protein